MTLIERIVELDGTITEKPYSKEQLAKVEEEKIKAAKTLVQIAQTEADKAAAQAKLAAIGLTADDLKALGL